MKEYKQPEMEVIVVDDVITTSGNGDDTQTPDL